MKNFTGIDYILMDVEGTTTKISFVSDLLFPYASERLEIFWKDLSDDERRSYGLEIESECSSNGEEFQDPVLHLKNWILKDKKIPVLKTIQGHIWEIGYQSGELKGHIYPEVIEVWSKWREQGKQLGIYSSGSVKAQKFLFKYSEFGDVTNYLSEHFDTQVGPKKDFESYQRIAKSLERKPQAILFLSDSAEELRAAQRAGFQVALIVREGAGVVQGDQKGFPSFKSFSEILS